MKKTKVTKKLTIAIPTRDGGGSILKTVNNVLRSKDIGEFDLSVAADRLSQELKEQLVNLGVKIVENNKNMSAIYKTKQLLDKSCSELIIYLNDDILFKKDTLSEIVRVFDRNPSFSMVFAKVKPLKAETVLEKILKAGTGLTNKIGFLWNNGDNYLLANGRCMAFRTNHLKKFRFPLNITNVDGFFYFENKKLNGKFKCASNAIVYNKNPRRIGEHLNQSSRFQYSEDELSNYFDEDLSSYYKIPIRVITSAYVQEFVKNPIGVVAYSILFLYTRIAKKKSALNPKWKADLSTKQI